MVEAQAGSANAMDSLLVCPTQDPYLWIEMKFVVCSFCSCMHRRIQHKQIGFTQQHPRLCPSAVNLALAHGQTPTWHVSQAIARSCNRLRRQTSTNTHVCALPDDASPDPMGYRRGHSRTGSDEEEGGVGDGKGGGPDAAAANGGASGAEDSDSSRGGTRPKRRRKQPWLRGLFTVFLIVEALVLYAVNEYSPVYDFEVLSVTTTAEDGTTTVRSFVVAAGGDREFCMCVYAGEFSF